MSSVSRLQSLSLIPDVPSSAVPRRLPDWQFPLPDSWAYRSGKRIFDVDVELGAYNDPLTAQVYKDAGPGRQGRSSCLLFQYQYDRGTASAGHVTFPKMYLVSYDSATEYQSWEPACIKSIEMQPSLDDPWVDLAVVKPLGAAYSINSNRDMRVSPLAQFEGAEADNLISYLFSGRWDRSTICAHHQRYGQF